MANISIVYCYFILQFLISWNLKRFQLISVIRRSRNRASSQVYIPTLRCIVFQGNQYELKYLKYSYTEEKPSLLFIANISIVYCYFIRQFLTSCNLKGFQ